MQCELLQSVRLWRFHNVGHRLSRLGYDTSIFTGRVYALRHGPVCVVNFGESGFVSTQGVIQLILELQSGNIPDLVIFYDGVNDVYAAYQSGRPTHQNFDKIAAKFEKGKSPPPSFVAWIESTNSFHLSKDW